MTFDHCPHHRPWQVTAMASAHGPGPGPGSSPSECHSELHHHRVLCTVFGHRIFSLIDFLTADWGMAVPRDHILRMPSAALAPSTSTAASAGGGAHTAKGDSRLYRDVLTRTIVAIPYALYADPK